MGSRLLVVCLDFVYVPLTHFLQGLMILQQSYGPSKVAKKFMNR